MSKTLIRGVEVPHNAKVLRSSNIMSNTDQYKTGYDCFQKSTEILSSEQLKQMHPLFRRGYRTAQVTTFSEMLIKRTSDGGTFVMVDGIPIIGDDLVINIVVNDDVVSHVIAGNL